MSIESFTFAAGDESRGFDAYRDLYAGGSDATPTGTEFRARLEAHRFDRLLLFDRRLRGVAHGRSPARVRRDGFDHFTIQLLLGGSFHGGAPGNESALNPGDVILFDMTRPQVTHATDARFITVSVPREVIEAAAPEARRFHGCVLPEAACGLLGDLIASLARRGASLAPESAARAARAVAELLAGALSGSLTPPSAEALGIPVAPGAVPVAALRLERAEAYIEAHLAEPRLDAARVASGVAVSRSVLYRLFAPAGGVAQYILARRLERLRAALRRPGEARSVTALAYDHGFASESHCIRAFRAAYGLPPGRYRQEARAGRPAADADRAADRSGRALMSDWVSEVS